MQIVIIIDNDLWWSQSISYGEAEMHEFDLMFAKCFKNSTLTIPAL